MQVREVMTRRVIPIPSTATVKTAAQTMRVLEVGALPVRDVDSIVGIITDRDITVRSVALGYKPARQTVYDIMTPDPVACFDDDSVQHACSVMAEHHVRRLLVSKTIYLRNVRVGNNL